MKPVLITCMNYVCGMKHSWSTFFSSSCVFFLPFLPPTTNVPSVFHASSRIVAWSRCSFSSNWVVSNRWAFLSGWLKMPWPTTTQPWSPERLGFSEVALVVMETVSANSVVVEIQVLLRHPVLMPRNPANKLTNTYNKDRFGDFTGGQINNNMRPTKRTN